MAKQTKEEFDWKPEKRYTFKLVGTGENHKGTYYLPTETLVYDNDEQRQRKVRLSPTELDPYQENQDPDAPKYGGLLKFRKGKMAVTGREKNVLNYLMALDHNADKQVVLSNPMYRFKLVDEELTEKEKAERKKLKLKVQLKLAEATKQELEDFLLSEYDYVAKTDAVEEELFNKAMAFAESNPEHVLKNFSTEESKLKSAIAKAFRAQKIKNTNGVVTWKETGVQIGVFKPTADKKQIELMVDWIDKGSKEAQDFIKKLSL